VSDCGVQVLTVVKHRLDNYLVTVSNYENLLVQASQYLAWRDEVMRQGSDGITRRDSVLSLPSNWTQRPSLGSASGIVLYCILLGSLQCFDAVGWAAGRASGL